MAAFDPHHRGTDPVLVSDAERNEAVERLNVFFTEGRLNLEEYSGRVDEAYAARTDAELTDVFRGLPKPVSDAPKRTVRRSVRATTERLVGIATPGIICTGVWAASGHGPFWPEWVWLATGIAGLGSLRRSLRTPAVDRPDRATHGGGYAPAGHDGPTRRMVLTAVFVDIVGSTKKAAGMGDTAWREVLRSFERLVEGGLETHHGRKLFTKGDEIVATFRSPARAIEYARAVRDAIRPLDLEIRAGIHTGEIEGRSTDLSGIALHIGQRVSASASAGEILVSSTVRDLALGSGVEFIDRGERELAGLPGSWHLYAVGDGRARP